MKFIAKTLYGLEQVLEEELKSLGTSEIIPLNRAVAFTGDIGLLYKSNYCLRTALSVLVSLSEFSIRSPRDLYNKALLVEWDKYIDNGKTFSIVPVINSPHFKHSGYAGQVLKDAVADWFRKKTGRRPDVNNDNPDIVFNLHISNESVTVSIDSTVIPLFKRGYRKEQGIAPLNEVLAAGIILLSDWKGNAPLIDPMCGSGTILIEAGLLAAGIPPGKFRTFFGFQRWESYDSDLFESIRSEYDSKILTNEIIIQGSDISGKAVADARRNIASAGLSGIISVSEQDFREMKAPYESGLIVMNPPYGQRIKTPEIENLYNMIGTTLKHSFPDYEALIITSDKEVIRHIGLKPAWKTILYNGALECMLVKYNLYSGSKRARYTMQS